MICDACGGRFSPGESEGEADQLCSACYDSLKDICARIEASIPIPDFLKRRLDPPEP